MTDIAIGVDLGGTKIACAAVDRDGHILTTHTEPTLAVEGADAVIARIVGAIRLLIRQLPTDTGHPVGIGIGCPGPVVNGVAINAVNLGWRNLPLVQRVREQLTLDLPVYAQNDVNAGAVAELVFGAAKGMSDFVYIAAGTGVGGGAFVDGHLVNGANGFGMDVGHISVDPHGRLCPCGNHGCVEMYLSGKGWVASAQAHLADHPTSSLVHAELNTHAILEAARQGDALALQAVHEAGEALGTAMAWCMALFDPALIVIGGGLGMAAYDLLDDPAQAAMRARLMPDLAPYIHVQRSQIEASGLGPAALVWYGQADSR